MSPQSTSDLVLALSRDLSGVEETPRRLAESVHRRAIARFGEPAIHGILQAYERGGLPAALAANAGVVRAMLYCLYTGLLPDLTGGDVRDQGPTALTTEDHFEALMWRVIQAHPPALSGGYFGHWHYSPEDA